MKSEGWLFLAKSGTYSNFRSYNDAYELFANKIEMLKQHQIQEEFTTVNVPRTNASANARTSEV